MTPTDPNPAREAVGRADRENLAKLIHAAEPQRVTLPDTPWTFVRVRQWHTGNQDIWHTEETPHVWRKFDRSPVRPEDTARIGSVSILAQPPTPDDGFTAEMYRQGYSRGYDAGYDVGSAAHYVPEDHETPDAAETDAPVIDPAQPAPREEIYSTMERSEARAIARGRDEALAHVVSVARQVHAVFGYEGFDQFADTLSKRRVALDKKYQREAGGDGHE